MENERKDQVTPETVSDESLENVSGGWRWEFSSRDQGVKEPPVFQPDLGDSELETRKPR